MGISTRNMENRTFGRLAVRLLPGILLCLCMLALSPGQAAAQAPAGKAPRDHRITGVVVDEKGGALQGATVTLVGYESATTVTGAGGKFTFDVPATGNLRVTMLGYSAETVPVDARNFYMIGLNAESTQISDIVVVGYGTQRKESVVGAISQVKGESLVQSGQSNVTNALSGKLSGVTTIQKSGMPGDDNSDILIRGLSSFNSSSPLVLVDGVERDFTSIDPNEISNISVLKDASATAVFGARGANGVIIVTTRRGTEGKPKLDFSASVGMQRPINVAEHVDAYTTMSLLNTARMNDQQFSSLSSQAELNEYRHPSSAINSIRYPDVNWFKEMTEPFAPVVNANFNIQGGTKFVKYFASAGYSHQGSLFKAMEDGKLDSRFYYNRINYRTNLDFNLTRTTVLSFNLGGSVGIQNKPSPRENDQELWKYVFGASTTKTPMYYPAWVMEQIPDPDYPGLVEDRMIDDMGDVTFNPYFTTAGGKFKQNTDSKLFTDINLKQNLDFITKGLYFQGKFSLSNFYKYNTLNTEYTAAKYLLDFNKVGTDQNPWQLIGGTDEVYTPNPPYTNVGGLLTGNSYADGFYQDLYYDLSINYNRTFGKHTVTALALMNRQEANKGTQFPYYNEALVGRVTYDFAHKYLLEVNMGYTGSERFSPDNRFGFFPSAAVGWVVSEEKFFQKALPWFSKLKFRYSQGLVGSDYANDRWLYISEYSKDANGYIKEDPAANTVAQWEEAMKRDLGIELGFMRDKLTFSVDFYDEHRTKMLIPVTNNIPMWVGNSSKALNRGEIKKHGFEVEGRWSSRLGTAFNYYVSGNFSMTENRIIYQDDPVAGYSHQKKAGTALGAQLSGVYLIGGGYYTSVDDIHSNTSPLADIGGLVMGDLKFLDYLPDGVLNKNDLAPIKGSSQPPISYAFGGGFNWKGFDFSFLFQGYAQKYINYDQMYEYEFYKGNYRTHLASLDYWSPTNPRASHGAVHYTSGWLDIMSWTGFAEAYDNAGYAGKIEGKSWRRADYLRLKEVYLGYTIKSGALRKALGIGNLKVYLTGNNLLTFTDLLEGDPENTYLLYGNYPQMMTLKAGLQVTF